MGGAQALHQQHKALPLFGGQLHTPRRAQGKASLWPCQSQHSGKARGARTFFQTAMEGFGRVRCNHQHACRINAHGLQARRIQMPPQARMGTILNNNQIPCPLVQSPRRARQSKSDAGRLIHEHVRDQLTHPAQSQSPTQRQVQAPRTRGQGRNIRTVMPVNRPHLRAKLG
ncbi:MAG: hypothetical protein RL186_1046 [Pseudomonadota bacterium]